MPLQQWTHSQANAFFFWWRKKLRFRRPGYKESNSDLKLSHPEARVLDSRYQFQKVRSQLSALTGWKALASLQFLEQMLEGISWPSSLEVVEPCCQGFSRLPAWRAYFEHQKVKARFTGVELDAFPLLQGLHSRWDHAHYYLSLKNDGSTYEPGDFLQWTGSADLILCFYPFVSAAPAVAWGLPAQAATPLGWWKSFERALKPGGYVLVVHQGDWEQNTFDQARSQAPDLLELKRREVLKCDFFPTRYPACASLYQKPADR